MKKTLVSALTTALVVGAASTTFAAANPFEDVPADHWAYDAVAQLAADGVIEGYGDGTYRGDQEITRYEMAQMIARAMAKNPNGADKALVDKLAAEFADELNNLGVRVAALEKKVDNVKWGGKIRYRFIRRSEDHTDDRDGNYAKDTNGLLLRFEPQMKINEHWTGKARIDYNNNREMKSAENYDTVSVDRIYVQGDYKNLKILLGKLPYKTQADYGLIMDRYFSGGSVTFGSDVKVALNAGRANAGNDALINFGGVNSKSVTGSTLGKTTSYGGIEVYNDRAKKFTWGIGYHQFRSKDFKDGFGARREVAAGYGIDKDQYGIWAIGLGYKFTPDLRLTAAYSQATGIKANDAMDADGASWKKEQKRSYSIELAYKGADPKKVNSWGAFIAYRHLGAFSSTGWNTYHLNGPQNSGERGFEIGLSWAPMKSVTGIVRYFRGREMNALTGGENHDVNGIFTEWNFIF